MKKIKFPKYFIFIFWITFVNLLVLFIRNQILDFKIDDTLMLNLFHGFLPLVFAFLLKQFYDKLNSFFFWLFTLVWVLYYPNSPYMISGLKHIAATPKEFQNYDTLIIFSLAMLSLFYGLISLKIMYNLFRKRHGKKFANLIITITLLLSCLGFYMGRVLFLFSADFFKHPIKVIKLVWNGLFPIGDNLSTYAIMFLFGGVQLMLIIMFKDVNDIETDSIITKEEN
ncbi:MAG: hypothetical protein B6I24_04900 [Bacteroidetes bacterium 4572_128]|nr:MAG: hypothetical protein B6I24_04900 [Bacteroidetes bacterium 4572_128]